jgi:trigger factor
MKVTATPADRSTVVLDIEIPAERLQRAVDESVRHLGRRTRVPGFRPGKIPRPMLERALGIRRGDPDAPNPIYDDAREHLYERTIIEALHDQPDVDVLQIPASPEWLSFEERSGAAYRVTVPVRPQVNLGDYQNFPFTPDVQEVTDERIDAVVEQLREQQASLVAVEDRAAEKGDFVVVRFVGRRDGQPVEGAQSDRMPLVIGNERMIPGFEDQLVGMREEEEKTFTVTFPDDYAEAELAGQPVEFTVMVRELRERRLPPLDDGFAQSVGAFNDLAALREELRARMRRSSLDRARHVFADRIIEYATANATVTPPDLLVEREIDVMIDELKVRLAQQRIGWEEYLKVTERDEARLREESREGAEHRVKVLLVLGAIADKEGVEVPDAAVEAELARGRQQNQDNRRLQEYLESPRGRAYIRSTLRRSLTVEQLIDRWIEAHPAFADVKHEHDQEQRSPDDVDVAADTVEVLEEEAALAAEPAGAHS